MGYFLLKALKVLYLQVNLSKHLALLLEKFILLLKLDNYSSKS